MCDLRIEQGLAKINALLDYVGTVHKIGDGWRRCQSALRSEATALSSVYLYLDELATFHEIEIRCSFKACIDSTSAISNAVSIRDLIPKHQYSNNAVCMTTIKDATRVISRVY